DRLLQADAAVAQGPAAGVEEAVGRRVVQVDVELVGKDELHLAERIRGTGEGAPAGLRADRGDLDALARQVARVLGHRRLDLLGDDVIRNVPGRIEDHEGDPAAEL